MKPDSAGSRKRGPERSEHRKVADKAGISRSQMWRWMQLAAIPEETFEQLLEQSDRPVRGSNLVKMARQMQGKQAERAMPRAKLCPHCGGALSEGAP